MNVNFKNDEEVYNFIRNKYPVGSYFIPLYCDGESYPKSSSIEVEESMFKSDNMCNSINQNDGKVWGEHIGYIMVKSFDGTIHLAENVEKYDNSLEEKLISDNDNVLKSNSTLDLDEPIIFKKSKKTKTKRIVIKI